MIRFYKKEDKQQLLEILKLNIPEYFHPSEETDFSNYLDHLAEDYFVIEKRGKIIGSGGINYFVNDNIARISWDMIHPDFQGKGYGKQLTEFRIEYIRLNPDINRVFVRTSQLSFSFYVKFGFSLEKIENDFWARGFDLYQMKLDLR